MFLSSCKGKNYLQTELDQPLTSSLQNKLNSLREGQEISKTKITFSAKLPAWLKGAYVRNGPGKYKIGTYNIPHWFDGFALVTSFDFTDKGVFYTSRFLESDQYKESVKNNRISLNGFSKFFGDTSPYHFSNDGQKVKTSNANINIENIGGRIVALGETPLPIEFELTQLSTIGFFDYNDTLKKADIWESAHMKRDPQDHALYNFYIDYGLMSKYVIYKINDGSTQRIKIAEKTTTLPSYMHDFSLTKNYIILTAYPLVVSPLDLRKEGLSFIGAHRWEPERKTIIYVFNKHNGTLEAKIKAEAIFAFHHINAYEENDNITLYLNSSTEIKGLIDTENYPYLSGENKTVLTRLSINLKENEVSKQLISKEFYELPNINARFLGRKNTYFYAIWFSHHLSEHGKNGFGLVKYNFSDNSTLSWYEDKAYAGEPLFIANPDSEKEDEGVILSLVYDEKSAECYLLVLNAVDMKEIARGKLPHNLPVGLHGKFF